MNRTSLIPQPDRRRTPRPDADPLTEAYTRYTRAFRQLEQARLELDAATANLQRAFRHAGFTGQIHD